MRNAPTFTAPIPLSAEDKKIPKNAAAALTAIYKTVTTQFNRLPTGAAASACLGSIVAWSQRFQKAIKAAGFPVAMPLSVEERQINRGAAGALGSIHATAGLQISRLKTAEDATALLTSLTAYCQRYLKAIDTGAPAGRTRTAGA
jgi:hypothetical protein